MNDTEKFLQIVEAHKNLPIVPMVDGEIAEDDCGRWLGSFGYCYVGKYILADERVYFFDDEEIDDVLTSILGWEAVENMSDEQMIAAYRNLNWTEAIIVNIDALIDTL